MDITILNNLTIEDDVNFVTSNIHMSDEWITIVCPEVMYNIIGYNEHKFKSLIPKFEEVFAVSIDLDYSNVKLHFDYKADITNCLINLRYTKLIEGSDDKPKE